MSTLVAEPVIMGVVKGLQVLGREIALRVCLIGLGETVPPPKQNTMNSARMLLHRV